MPELVLANILGPDAVIVLVLAIVLLFGAGQLPKTARSIGEASKELRKARNEAAGDGQSQLPPGGETRP